MVAALSVGQGNFFRIVAGERDISVLRSVQTACGVHQASFTPEDKAAGTWSWWLFFVYNSNPPHTFIASGRATWSLYTLVDRNIRAAEERHRTSV